MKKLVVGLLVLVSTFTGFAQEEETTSNIQTYTPSKLLSQGQWDIKFFNNLYTETESTFVDGTKPRETYFTSTVDVFTGISANNRINVGLLLEFRSNVINDRKALDVFKFDGDVNSARSGLTSFAPAIKFNPLKGVSNFTIQSALHIPLVKNESENGVFLDQKGFIFQNRFFYDYNFNSKWQLFTELNAEYNFGKEEDSFANNSVTLTPGLFLGYFPSSKFTVLGLVQHQERIDAGNGFPQSFTAVGGGAKYQISKVLNIETLYTKFVRGYNTGLGQSFNLGLRALF